MIRNMGGEDDGQSIIGKPPHQRKEPNLVGEIKMRCRLIEDHQLRRLDQHARDLRELAFAATDLGIGRVDQVRDAQRVQLRYFPRSLSIPFYLR